MRRPAFGVRWTSWAPGDAFAPFAWQQVARLSPDGVNWLIDFDRAPQAVLARIDVAATQAAAAGFPGPADFWIDSSAEAGFSFPNGASTHPARPEGAGGLVLTSALRPFPLDRGEPAIVPPDAAAPSAEEEFALVADVAPDQPAAGQPVQEQPAADEPAALVALRGLPLLRLLSELDVNAVGLSRGQAEVSENSSAVQFGDVSLASLGRDLADIVGNGLGGAGDALFVGANGGELNGNLFLVVERNGLPGFQPDQDEVLVVGLPQPAPSEGLTPSDGPFFI
jgi:hypothetical protein